MIPNIVSFPAQKKSDKEKNEKWMRDCVDSGATVALFDTNNGIRQTMYNKKINYDLANDILDERDVHKIMNPFGLASSTFPAKMQNYPIVNPKIDLLIGEEYGRHFNFSVRTINMDAVNEKQQMIKDRFIQYFTEKVQQKNLDEEQTRAELAKLDRWAKYDAVDLREEMADQILRYLYRKYELKYKFNKGMYDLLIAGEEIYCADIVADTPILRKCSPMNVFTIRQGDSDQIENADIIIEYGYKSVGEVIDTYYEYLKPDQVRQLESAQLANKAASTLDYMNRPPIWTVDNMLFDSGSGVVPPESGGLVQVNTDAVSYFGGSYDMSGNVRVVRVVWKSLRKIGKLKYYDENAEPQYDFVPEQYKPDESRGEEVEWIWINEWWEGTRIADDIYVKMQPRPVQFRTMDNISKCSSGYVGITYNINNSKTKSLMDRMKPYQYLYNVIMYRTELAFAKNYGKIGVLDLSKVPDNWDVDKWLYYATQLGWAVYDPFNAGKEGQAMGKLAGNMTMQSSIDTDTGNYIQQHVNMLAYIKSELEEIAGISRQRQGAIENRETIGGVERAINQSSMITERLFQMHSLVKLRALTALLETARIAYKNKKTSIQYVTDDMVTAFIDIDGDVLNSADYGIFINDAVDEQKLIQTIQQGASQEYGKGTINVKTLFDIMASPSIASMRRKLESDMEVREAMVRKQQQDAMAMQQQQLQQQADLEERKLQLEKYKIDTEAETKITVSNITAYMRQQELDINNNGIPDPTEIASNALAERKQNADEMDKMLRLKHDMEVNSKKVSIEEEKVKLKEKELKLKAEEIKSKERIAKTNKNKYDKK